MERGLLCIFFCKSEDRNRRWGGVSVYTYTHEYVCLYLCVCVYIYIYLCV